MSDAGTDGIGPQRAGRPRVVLFGMRCTFSGPVLDALCAAPDVDLAAVVLPGRTPDAPPGEDPMLDTMRACGITPEDVAHRGRLMDPAFRAVIENIAPDVIITACFPWRLPRWLLELPPCGCLNLHPSLLPAGRGPEPVFWAFRRGLDETGVTLHLMDEGLDTGPVIAQARVPIPDGATIPALELALARIGTGLALDHLRASPGSAVTLSPQREEDAWYAPLPRDADLVVPTSWEATHAARFIHAVTPVYGAVPVLVLATGQRLVVEAVMGVEEGEGDGDPVTMRSNEARIRFSNGTLTCRIVHARHVLRLHQ